MRDHEQEFRLRSMCRRSGSFHGDIQVSTVLALPDSLARVHFTVSANMVTASSNSIGRYGIEYLGSA